jgi:hypothetical protein
MADLLLIRPHQVAAQRRPRTEERPRATGSRLRGIDHPMARDRRDDTPIGGGPDQRDGQPCAPSRFTELQIAVSLFDRTVVSPSRPALCGDVARNRGQDWSERREGHRRRRARSGLDGGEHDVSVGQVGKRRPQAGAAAAVRRGARPFDGRPGASRLFGGRCRATCPGC